VIAELESGLEQLCAELAPEGIELDFSKRRIFRAPGRVNLIGDHTDYNGGLVLPVAIDLAVYLCCVPTESVYLTSMSEPGVVAVTADGASTLSGHTLPRWGAYPRGVLAELASEGRPAVGFTGFISSGIPEGRGLSSSAALEVAVAKAALALSDFDLDLWNTAEACRRAEERYAGVECGIMDQAVSLMGKAGSACLIDTARRHLRYIPVPELLEIVVVDSGIRRDLATGEYNDRRAECSAALASLRSTAEFAETAQLADLHPDDLESCKKILPTRLFQRVRHVVTENDRVEAVCRILSALSETPNEGTTHRLLGELQSAIEKSHESLVADYEAGHPLTDRIVELASAQTGYIGARQTGAGWGGSVVVFCEKGRARELAESIIERLPSPEQVALGESSYRTASSSRYHICEVSDGACEI
jgi:galactokinase